MSTVSLVAILIVVGVGFWLVNSYLPMNGKLKNIITAMVVVAVVVGVLNAFGVFSVVDAHVPHVGGN